MLTNGARLYNTQKISMKTEHVKRLYEEVKPEQEGMVAEGGMLIVSVSFSFT